MRIVTFEAEHVSRIELRDFDRLGLEERGGMAGLLDLAALYRAAGPCWTALDGDAVVGCGGVGVQPGATGNAWALTSPLVERWPLAFSRAARRCIEAAEQGLGLTRIQTTVHARHDVRRKWFEFLGFSCEGPMRNFIGNDTYYLYARVR